MSCKCKGKCSCGAMAKKSPVMQDRKVATREIKKYVGSEKAKSQPKKPVAKPAAKSKPKKIDNPVDMYKGLKDAWGNPVGGEGTTPPFSQKKTAAWARKEGKDPKGGLNAKGVASYRKENPGSKLQMAVTKKPSELKPGSKDAKRRESFCARMSGMPGPMKKPNGEPTRKKLALDKWNC